MQVVSVKIPNTSTDSHHSPEAFFREYGFESVNDNGVGFKRAIVPKSKNSIVLLEYENPTRGMYKPFYLVKLLFGEFSNNLIKIDEGLVKLVLPGNGNELEVTASGREVSSWEIAVKPTAITSITDLSLARLIVVSEFGAVSDTNSKLETELIPDEDGFIETQLPSTTESMIKEASKRAALIASRKGNFRELMEDMGIKDYSPGKKVVTPKQFKAIKSAAEKLVVKLEPFVAATCPPVEVPKIQPEIKYPLWRKNPHIIAFMEKHCGGKTSTESFAVALKEYMRVTGRTRYLMAIDLREGDATIVGALSVLEIDPALRALVDLPMNDKNRMIFSDVVQLSKFPIEMQVAEWGIASQEKKKMLVTRKLKMRLEIWKKSSQSPQV